MQAAPSLSTIHDPVIPVVLNRANDCACTACNFVVPIGIIYTNRYINRVVWLCALPCPRSTPPKQPIKARAAETAARRKRYLLFGMLSPKQAGLAGATPTERGNDG